MHFSLPLAQSPAYPKLSGICENYFHAVDDQQGFGEVEALLCSGRGDGEGEKAYQSMAGCVRKLCPSRALLMSGVGNPL